MMNLHSPTFPEVPPCPQMRSQADLVDQLFTPAKSACKDSPVVAELQAGEPESSFRQFAGNPGGNDRHHRSRVSFFMNRFRKLASLVITAHPGA